jgi:hypothetical protein
MEPKQIIIWTGVIVFILTAVIAVLHVSGIRKINDKHGNILFKILMVEIVVICVAIFSQGFTPTPISPIPIDKVGVNENCMMTIVSHKDDDNVTRSVRIKGKSNECSKDSLYTLVLVDKDGDHYKSNDIQLMVGGYWSSSFSLGPAWSKKPVVVKVVGYFDNTVWIKGDTRLPLDVKPYTDVTLNVE